MVSSRKPEKGLRIGIVGCGQMGRKHATNCSRTEGVSAVAVYDMAPDRSASLAKEIKATPFHSPEAMIAEFHPDALIVATPPGERKRSVDVALAGRSAVFVEKPIALDMDTAEGFCGAAKKASVVNAVGFHLRYSPLTQKARELISGKHLTHVRTITTTSYYLKMDMPPWFLQRKHSGGPLLEQSLHMLDTARYLVGDITHVFARGHRLIRPDLKEYDSEDTIVLAYQFVNGVLGTHTDSCAMMEFNWEIELFGPDWRLLVDYARNRLRGRIDEKAIEVDMPEVDIHMMEIRAFLDAVRSQNPKGVLSDFSDATRTLRVTLAGDRSIKTSAWEATANNRAD